MMVKQKIDAQLFSVCLLLESQSIIYHSVPLSDRLIILIVQIVYASLIHVIFQSKFVVLPYKWMESIISQLFNFGFSHMIYFGQWNMGRSDSGQLVSRPYAM